MGTAAKYRHQITVEQETESVSSSGVAKQTPWATYATLWAAVRALQGREYFSGNLEVTEHRALFTVRHSTESEAISNKGFRVVWDGRTYDIESPPIDPDGRSREIEIRGVLRQ